MSISVTADDIILSNHARERMEERNISLAMIREAMRSSDKQEREEDDDIEFIRTINGRKVHVIANYLEDEHKWLVKTTWVRGEDDIKKPAKRRRTTSSGEPEPLWLMVLRLILEFLKRKK